MKYMRKDVRKSVKSQLFAEFGGKGIVVSEIHIKSPEKRLRLRCKHEKTYFRIKAMFYGTKK